MSLPDAILARATAPVGDKQGAQPNPPAPEAAQVVAPVHEAWAVYYDNLGKQPYTSAYMSPWELYCSESEANAKFARSSSPAHYIARKVYIYDEPMIASGQLLAIPARIAGLIKRAEDDNTRLLAGNGEFSGKLAIPVDDLRKAFMEKVEAPAVNDVCAEMRAMCSACGGTGDVTRVDGEYQGQCDCASSLPTRFERLKADYQLVGEKNDLLRAFAKQVQALSDDWQGKAETAQAQVESLQAQLDARTARVPDNSMDWASIDGAVAYELIERNAKDRSDAGRMMEAFVLARMDSANVELSKLDSIFAMFAIGVAARNVSTLATNVENTLRFTNLLGAVEREFFMAPGNAGHCMVNSWGSTEAEYLEQFRVALPFALARTVDVAPKYWLRSHLDPRLAGDIPQLIGADQAYNYATYESGGKRVFNVEALYSTPAVVPEPGNSEKELADAVLMTFKSRPDRDGDTYCLHCKKDFVYWRSHEPGCVVTKAKEIVGPLVKRIS